MATARSIPQRPVVQYVELTLTDAEAQTLRDILSHIGGDITNSRRRYADNIAAALTSVGVEASSVRDFNLEKRSIYFLNEV